MTSAKTATDLTIEHYKRPEVKDTIRQFCHPGTGGFRGLNGDAGWYLSTDNGHVRLRTAEDYDDTIGKFRSLYTTLDVLDPSVKEVSEKWDEVNNRPENPIGTFNDCLSYTLAADIDSIGDVINNPAVKQAVEEMARFMVQKLQDAGVKKSVYCLYSGGGIYVMIHHALCQVPCGIDVEDLDRKFRIVTGGFKKWLADVEYEFFKIHPEFVEKVKVDKLTHQKTKFKSIFSIHKKHPFAVVPLNPKNICIDFERARLPLKPEVLDEGKTFYSEYDLAEKDRLVDLLAPYCKMMQGELDDRKARSGNYEIFRCLNVLENEFWPPCMQNVLAKVEPGKGPHRALAVLSAFLYQIGWSNEDSFKLWQPLANRCGVENRIFEVWHGQMCCPNCETIQKTCSGYPEVGLGGLGYCETNELCRNVKWPGEYAIMVTLRGSYARIQSQVEKDPTSIKRYLEELAEFSLIDPIGFAAWLEELDVKNGVKSAAKKEIKKIATTRKKANRKTDTVPHIDDEDVIRLAEQKKVSRFRFLMAGVLDEVESEDDARAVLLKELAYYCGSKTQIERIFKKSPLCEKGKTYDDEIRDAMKASEADGHFELNEDDSRIEIMVNDRRLHDVTNETLWALEEMNSPPKVFKRGRDLCRVVRDDHNLPSIEIHTHVSLRSLASRSARFLMITSSVKQVYPPGDVIQDILAASDWPFPRLVGVSGTPIVREDGSICTTPGFDSVSGIYYDGSLALDIPEKPTAEDAKKAIDYVLEEVFEEFPFVDEASKIAILAGMLTQLIRPMIPGLVPMLVVTKATPGTGASLLMDLVSLVAYGMPCATTKFADDDTENDKRITAMMVSGRILICWDNVDRQFKSASVNRLTTSEMYESRILGVSKSVTFENRTCTYVTGNNVQLAGDMPRRCYFSKMETKEAKPWERKEFKHPQIKQWVLEHRKELVEALLTAVRAWVVNGRPKGKCGRTIGSYETWVEILDGILSYAGASGFLTNLEDFYEEEDSDANDWGAFLEEIYTLYQEDDGKFKLMSLESFLNEILRDIAPPEILVAIEKTGKLNALGITLKRYNNRRFEGGDKDNYYVLRIKKDPHTKKNEYRVERVPKMEAQTRL